MGPLGDFAGVNIVCPLKSNKSPATKLFSFGTSVGSSCNFLPILLRTGFEGAFFDTFDEVGATKVAVEALLDGGFVEDAKDGGGFSAIDLLLEAISLFLRLRSVTAKNQILDGRL